MLPFRLGLKAIGHGKFLLPDFSTLSHGDAQRIMTAAFRAASEVGESSAPDGVILSHRLALVAIQRRRIDMVTHDLAEEYFVLSIG